jgi:hypothetical protein
LYDDEFVVKNDLQQSHAKYALIQEIANTKEYL